MKKKDQYKLLLGIIVLVLLAHQFGFITIPGLPRLQTGEQGGTQPPISIDDQMRQAYLKGIGMFEVQTKAYDSADPATSRTVGTNLNVYWYKFTLGKWKLAVTQAASGTTYLDMKAEDNGYVWVAIDIPTNQAYYIDYKKILEDPYVVGYQYVDVDDDGVREFVFQYDMRNHAIPSSGYPVVVFYAYLITYDSSFTGLNNLSNSTGIGTTTTTKTYEWYLSFSAVKKGVAIYKVEFKVGTTDETKVRLKKLQIPGLGYLDVSQFQKSFTGSDIRWTYTFSTSFDGANYLVRSAQDTLNKFYMTCEVEYTLSSGDDIRIDLTVYYLEAQTEAGKSTNDYFYAQT
jgi:hypothetical protein